MKIVNRLLSAISNTAGKAKSFIFFMIGLSVFSFSLMYLISVNTVVYLPVIRILLNTVFIDLVFMSLVLMVEANNARGKR